MKQISQLKKGFTLLELLVAMSVTVIIVGMLVYVVSMSFDTLSRGTSSITSYQKGYIAVEQLASDLESLVLQRGNTTEFLVAEASYSQASNYNNMFKDESNKDPNVYSNFSRLAFLTVASDRYDGDITNLSSKGNVSTVEYGVAYKDPVNAVDSTAPTFVLYRRLIDPDTTFDNILGNVDMFAGIQSSNQGSLDDAENLVTDNIKELSITFHVEYDAQPAGTSRVATKRLVKLPVVETGGITDTQKLKSFKLTGNGLTIDTQGPDNTFGNQDDIKNGRIVAIDINAQVIQQDAVPLLSVEVNGAGADNIKQKIEQATDRFTKTIYLPQL